VVQIASRDRPIRGSANGEAPDAIVVFHGALLRDPRTFAGLRKDGTFIFNAPAKSIPEELAALPATARAMRIDAAGIAAKEKCAMNAVLLGALCGALPFLDAEAVLETFCNDDASKNGFRRGMKEPETLADVGEAQGDLPTLSPALSQGRGGLYRATQVLDRLSRQGVTRHHHLEPVVVGRVVAAGDHHARLRAQMMRCEVGHRRGDHAHVDHVGPRRANAVGQRCAQLGAGEATVATDHDRVAAALLRERPQRLSDRADDGRRQRAADDAADVVGLEDLGR
jgi:hypothetical protein